MGRRDRERKERIRAGIETPLAVREEAERWEWACETFPDPLEAQVIELAEQEGVTWRRIIDYGLRFFYESEEQMERFRARMAAIGQVLDE